MPADPERTTPAPEKDRKTTELKDLPSKEESQDTTSTVKGGAVGPCDRQRR